MCGIFGAVALKGKLTSHVISLAKESLQILHHRGPDENGIHLGENFVLAHTRLSIIDLKTGIQPLTNREKTILLVCNGEIYNHQSIRKKCLMESSGGKDGFLDTASDSASVIYSLQHYKDYGKMLRSLDGMFSLILVERSSNSNDVKMIAARDPLGIKPLYSGIHECDGNECICFGSEIKTMRKLKNVQRIPNGHFYSSESQEILPYFKRSWIDLSKSNEHWVSPLISPSIKFPVFNEDIAISKIRELITYAVEKRMMSDVELGVFLSGGLDSTIVTALAARFIKEQSNGTKKLHSFSVGIKNESPDLEFALEASKMIGTVHHVVEFSTRDVIREIPSIVNMLESYDVPLILSSVPNYFLAKESAKFCKVVLTGEGADELFCGYKFFSRMSNAKRVLETSLRTINTLDSINLQRNDRMCMCHSLEARVPFFGC